MNEHILLSTIHSNYLLSQLHKLNSLFVSIYYNHNEGVLVFINMVLEQWKQPCQGLKVLLHLYYLFVIDSGLLIQVPIVFLKLSIDGL